MHGKVQAADNTATAGSSSVGVAVWHRKRKVLKFEIACECMFHVMTACTDDQDSVVLLPNSTLAMGSPVSLAEAIAFLLEP